MLYVLLKKLRGLPEVEFCALISCCRVPGLWQEKACHRRDAFIRISYFIVLKELKTFPLKQGPYILHCCSAWCCLTSNNADSGTESTLSKSAHVTKQAVQWIHWKEGMPSTWTLIRVKGNLMRVSKAKCKVLHTGQGNPQYQYRQGNKWIDCSPVEEDLGILVNDKLSMHWHCAFSSQNPICALGCIQNSVASRAREVILFVW